MRHPCATLALVGSLLLTACGNTEDSEVRGKAGDVVDCDTRGEGGTTGQDVYSEGATADSPEAALRVARSERAFGGVQEGLREDKRDEDRVLYVLEVDDVVKQAVILRNGPATEGAGGPGWYVESWAVCDYSELPRSFTDSIGLEVWSDADGKPVPTTVLAAWQGPEHCNWQSMTFLEMGDTVYVREPQPDLSAYFAEPYDEHAALPDTAVDTGYTRDGARLWISADEQRAYVGTPDDVELWPRTVKPLGCV